MAPRLVHLAIAAEQPARLARFWSDLLAWHTTAESPDEVQPAANDGWTSTWSSPGRPARRPPKTGCT